MIIIRDDVEDYTARHFILNSFYLWYEEARFCPNCKCRESIVPQSLLTNYQLRFLCRGCKLNIQINIITYTIQYD